MTVEKGEVERAGEQGRCLAPADSRAEDGSDDEDPEETKDRPLMFSCPDALPEYYYNRSASSVSFAKM